MVDQDRLRPADRLLRHVDLVPQRRQRLPLGRAVAALQLQHAPVGERARRLDRGLRVHAEIDDVRQEPHMARRLVLAAHHPERHRHPAVLHQHRRDDRVHRPLARRRLVRMPGLQREPRAAVVEQDAALRRRDPRPEAVEDRVDQRHRHQVPVHHRQVDRVAMHRLHRRNRPRHRALRIDLRGQPLRQARRQHPVQVRRRRIGDEAVPLRIGQLRRLRLQMRPRRAARVHRGHVEAAQDVGHQQRRGALPVGRQLHQLDAAIAAPDRRDVVRRHRREILLGVAAAGGAQRGGHVGGMLALVEAGAPLGRDPPQQLRLAGGVEHLPHPRRGAVHQVHLARGPLQRVGRHAPVMRHPRRHRHPGLGMANRGRQHRVEPLEPVIRRQPHEGVDGTGQRHRIGRAQRHRVVPRRAQRLGVETGGRAPRAVQADDLLRPGRLDQHEAVAAQPAHLRLADAQQHGGGKRRVHRVAPLLQHVDGRLRGQRVRGRGHAATGQDERTVGLMEIAHDGQASFLPRAPDAGRMTSAYRRARAASPERKGKIPGAAARVGAVARRRRREALASHAI